MSSAHVVDVTHTRESLLGEEVLALFDKRCGQLMMKILEEREGPAQANPDDSVIEIEARTGVKENNNFVPGVSKSFFRSMLDYFLKKEKSGTWLRADDRSKKVGFKHSDHVDVTFEDDIRVTVKLIRDSNERVRDIEVQEVITKRKLGKPVDFVVRAPQHGDKIHLRIGNAVEERVAENSSAYLTHVKAAKRAILDAFNVSTRVKVLGGIDLTLRKEAPPVYLFFPTNGESLARGPMGFDDPLYTMASRHEDMLDVRIAGQLKWTLLQPSNLPGCKGRPDAILRDKKTLDPKINLTNLPGCIDLGHGNMYAAYACQYIIRVPLTDVLCGHGKFAKDTVVEEPDMDDERDMPAVKVFRRKIRWSFELRHNQHLDMTETRQSSNLNTLDHETPVFEVELEKTLSSTGCRNRSLNELAVDLRAHTLADEFLVDIASRIYGHALPPLALDKVPRRWRDQAEKDKTRVKRFGSDLEQADERAKDSYKDAMQLDAPELADQKGTAGFYNKLDRSSDAKRCDSLIYHLRCLNNFVKNVVIKEALSRSLENSVREPGSGIHVLDLACGKGADMRKIMSAAKSLKVRIDQYVGVDIARNSLEDAVSRLDSMPAKQRPNFRIQYVEADLGQHFLSSEPDSENDFKLLEQWDSQTQTWTKQPPSRTIPLSSRFDLVTMQFSMHYMFQNYERAHHFFSTLSQHMRPGSVFIATTVYADEMVSKLMQAGPGETSFSIKDGFGVETCRVQFDPNFLSQFKPGDVDGDANMEDAEANKPDEMMGIRYTFTLLDGESDDAQAVNAPEWLVPQALLVKVATAHNFNLVRYERLPNCASRHINYDGNRSDALYRHMNVLNHRGTVSGPEWDIASLYVVVELQKEEKPTHVRQAIARLKERVADYKDLSAAEKQRLLDSIMK
mmetsp:Transcript_16654/g.32280  ORF Transcript_16654/g.32280 Transcript_16654/m.32280 type:complete len:903 (+) Transcript_16654:440-3148(+)|eukprot:CAMPEP_0171543362 /NCGR_PEP_ID=MMETSP0960-20121227/2885_1 /TAXON_ID=87120 /ORGANISM="Aurantiochytrium limacinum, Strain ATCCMYA-1381" /LENGTH=902 /DNA_ID=CAMNT_0012091015 /DNA_START=159 /DNA_END=2867 /DNA_ORIENTATION=-